MTYTSLMDALESHWVELKNYHAYSGTVGSVMKELNTALRGGLNGNTSTQNLAALVFHPPRIIRAVLDAKIEERVGIEMVNYAVNFGLSVYRNPLLAMFDSGDFSRSLRKSGLYVNSVSQILDNPTRNATHPYKSRNTLKLIQDDIGSHPVLFLALAHGGVAAGMDVFLRYGQKDSLFYPIRYSRTKHHDPFPRVNAKEISLLKRLAEGKEIVVFDEDQTTGITLTTAVDYFNRLFENQKVHPYSNFNAAETKDAEILKELSRT